MLFGIFLLGLLIGFSFGLGFVCGRIQIFRVKNVFNLEILRIWNFVDNLSNSVRKLEVFKEKIESTEDDGK